MSKNDFIEQFSMLDDVALLELYQKGDQAACTALIARYAALIGYKTSAFHISGVDNDDIKQEAYMGLLGAIRSYNKNGGASFSTYAAHCVSNRLKNMLAANLTNKAAINKNVISLDEISSDSLKDSELQNPEVIFIQNENYSALIDLLEKHLSRFEKEVLFLYLSGCDYQTVAKKLSSSPKSVDNALQRARKKLKSVLNNL